MQKEIQWISIQEIIPILSVYSSERRWSPFAWPLETSGEGVYVPHGPSASPTKSRGRDLQPKVVDVNPCDVVRLIVQHVIITGPLLTTWPGHPYTKSSSRPSRLIQDKESFLQARVGGGGAPSIFLPFSPVFLCLPAKRLCFHGENGGEVKDWLLTLKHCRPRHGTAWALRRSSYCHQINGQITNFYVLKHLGPKGGPLLATAEWPLAAGQEPFISWF